MADLGAAWASAVDVAVVGETMADLLGIPDDDGLMADPATGFEVALADWVAVTNHLTAIKELRDRGFHAQGRSRDDFWREVLAPIWSVSTHATVVDRYLFRKIWNGKRDEHVRWLLRRLNETPGKRGRVVLIGEALSSVDADMDLVLQVISEACQGGRIDAVTVQLTPPHRGSSPYLPHDRHIRFDNAAVYLNAGFDRLSCSTITAPDGLVWEYRWAHDAMQALRAVEKRALRARGLRTEFDPSS
ncbi:hypothetical protein ACX31A_11725 [Dermacoccus nishinomiyaensis]